MLLNKSASCIFANNAAYGFQYDVSNRVKRIRFQDCIFAFNASGGLYLPVGSTGNITPLLSRNIFYDNGGYGLTVGTNGAQSRSLNHHNAYGDNATADHTGWADGYDKLTLTADPFVLASSNDFNINTATGGGAVLRASTFTLPG